MPKRKTLKQRIREAYAQSRNYHDMLEILWPRDKFPKAWRYSMNGGPPGCAMTFGAALHRMGGSRSSNGQKVYLPPE